MRKVLIILLGGVKGHLLMSAAPELRSVDIRRSPESNLTDLDRSEAEPFIRQSGSGGSYASHKDAL